MMMGVTVVPICWHSGRHAAAEEPKSLVLLKHWWGSSNPLNTTSCLCSTWVLLTLLGINLHRLKATVRLWVWEGERVRSSGGFFVNSADQRSKLRDRCDMEINMWVSRWCCQQNVSCLDHGTMFRKPYGTRKNYTSPTSIYWCIETGSQNPPDQCKLFCP